MILEPIARGELVAVIPHWTPRRETVHAVFASRRGLLPAVRAFIDHLAARFAQLPAE
jgi:DNA-binding transcriptional LysR family regulator